MSSQIYSLLWPVAVVNVGDVCTRDRVSVLFTGEPALQLEVSGARGQVGDLTRPCGEFNSPLWGI